MSDIAAIALADPASLNPALPGGGILAGRPVGGFGQLLNARVVAWGAATRAWRQGEVVGLWPRRPIDGRYGLCLIHQTPPSGGGDSGGIWMTPGQNGYVAVAMHYGLETDAGPAFAIGVDVNAALTACQMSFS